LGNANLLANTQVHFDRLQSCTFNNSYSQYSL
jgi:hypothetical protein